MSCESGYFMISRKAGLKLRINLTGVRWSMISMPRIVLIPPKWVHGSSLFPFMGGRHSIWRLSKIGHLSLFTTPLSLMHLSKRIKGMRPMQYSRSCKIGIRRRASSTLRVLRKGQLEILDLSDLLCGLNWIGGGWLVTNTIKVRRVSRDFAAPSTVFSFFSCCASFFPRRPFVLGCDDELLGVFCLVL